MVKFFNVLSVMQTAPSTFWVLLLLSSGISFGISPVMANEAQDVVAFSITSQQVSDEIVEKSSADPLTPVAAVILDQTDSPSAEPAITDPITPVAQLNSAEENRQPESTQETLEPWPAQESETPTESEEPALIDQITSVADLMSAEEAETVDDPMGQVTNVSQLRDVQPTDWAYEALRSLVERYGCIAGYPDGTFRGNRALSRYEFAAGVNACLTQIEKLIAASSADFVTKEDLAALQKLVDEFSAEIATLRTRVDNLEGRTQFLEDHQFSTTTRLNGLAWFNITGAGADDDVQVEASSINPPYELRSAGRNSRTRRPLVQTADDPETTLSNLVWLTLETSFTGKDSLVTQLAAGNGISPTNVYASAGLFNTFGVPFLDQTAGPEVGDARNDVILRELFYRFPVTENLQLVVGPRVNFYRFFDNNAFTFFLTGATTFNSNGSPLSNTIDRGAGAVVLWDINKQFKFRVAYLGEADEFLPGAFGFNTASDPTEGVFGGTNTTSAELTFSPTDKINLRFLYTYSHINNNQPIFDENGNITGFGIGGATGEPVYGVADDGFGGSINATAHFFGLNFDWLVTRGIGVFGRYGYGITNIYPRTRGRDDGQIDAQSVQLGLAFPDLGKKGALAVLSYMIPFSVLDGREFLAAGGGDGGVQYEFEASYFFPITNNIAIVPAFYLIGNPNNFSDNPNIYVGNLRAQFSF